MPSSKKHINIPSFPCHSGLEGNKFSNQGNNTMTYKIFRSFHPTLDREPETVKTGLTLDEAQKHCQDPATHEEGVWFDGYTEE